MLDLNHPRFHLSDLKKRERERGGISSALALLRYGKGTFTYLYLPLAELRPRPAIQGLSSRPLGVSTQVADRPIHADRGEEVKHGPQLLQDKKTSLLVKAFVNTHLLRTVEQLHWPPWQKLIFAGCSV